ncbi:BA14K family protein [Devosia sp.]|uniref:BA14K family protein n=1 Tax=Devosia sp. TaxID=1871048 RepID=UPI001AD23ACF|nr:BA14K family protein [Devosia sp.]MBN9310645.1 BA14K family protein [Devosia sp.]
MRKIASAAVATMLAGLMTIPAPANAASVSISIGQQSYVSQQCMAHPNWKGCDDWKHNRDHWGKNDYRNWYLWNRSNLGSVAAGLFGFAIGAAIFSGMNRDSGYSGGNSSYDSHVAACEAHYRSYNAETDMYVGYDGMRHRCML